MKRITSAATSVQEVLLERQKDDVFEKRLERRRRRSPTRDVTLTCREDEVEALLSEGESTETS
jgi:hypothetical protein